MFKLRFGFVFCILFSSGFVAFAHQAVPQDIERLTTQIDQSPSAERYLERGRLWLTLSHFQKAYEDFLFAYQHDKTNLSAVYYLGVVNLQVQNTTEALKWAKQFVATVDASNSAALVRGNTLLGNVYVKRQEFVLACPAYHEAWKRADPVLPEHHLNWIRCLEADRQWSEAVKAVEQSVQRSGPLVVLLQAGQGIEEQREHWAGALVWVDRMLQSGQREDVLHKERARLLLQMARYEEAAQALIKANEAYSRLPLMRRESQAKQALKEEMDRLQQQIAEKTAAE